MTFDLNRSVNAVLLGDNKGTSMKYRQAAHLGEVTRSQELCQLKYPTCEYTAKEIIKMGEDFIF